MEFGGDVRTGEEYARLYLDEEMQALVDAEGSKACCTALGVW